MIVPEYNTHFADIDCATIEQKKFYFLFCNKIKNSEYVDVENNLSYIFLYLYESINQLIKTKDIKTFEYNFFAIHSFYSQEYFIINSYIYRWLKDAYLFIEDYDKAWECLKKYSIKNGIYNKNGWLHISNIINIRSKCTDTSINAEDVINIIGMKWKFTQIGEKYLDEIKLILNEYLVKFQRENNKNIIQFLFNKYSINNLVDKDFDELSNYILDKKLFEKSKIDCIKHVRYKELKRDDFLAKIKETEIGNTPLAKENFHNSKEYSKYKTKLLNYYQTELKYSTDSCNLFSAAPNHCRVKYIDIPDIYNLFFEGKLSLLMRDCENIFREKNNLPLIGEGWISETILFYEIRKVFSDYNVIQHGKPEFLGKQHLDVYIPDLYVALEYQGRQHDEAIEYFGGIESLNKTRERDERKRLLCEKNGLQLIYVYPNYSISNVINEIVDYCNKKCFEINCSTLSNNDIEVIKYRVLNNGKPKEFVEKNNKIKHKEDMSITVKYSDKELKYHEDKYIEEYNNCKHIIDTHFVNNKLIYLYNANKQNQICYDKCIEMCIKDIALFEDCIKLFNESNQIYISVENKIGNLNFSYESFIITFPFRKLCILYENKGEIEKAISIANKALQYSIQDGTKGGFYARIQKMKKKLKNII